jgi:hypothetical protein
MNLVNELGSDIALAFLFERRYREKLEGNEVVDLISRVRFVLEPTSGKSHTADASRYLQPSDDRPISN